MASLLDKLSKEMNAVGIRPRTQAARSWILGKINKIRIPTNRSNILNDANRISSSVFVGRMFFFAYDAKYKDVLPVWDKFPLVIPMDLS